MSNRIPRDSNVSRCEERFDTPGVSSTTHPYEPTYNSWQEITPHAWGILERSVERMCRQNGICPDCGQLIEAPFEIHHIIPVASLAEDGGQGGAAALPAHQLPQVVLHKHCHQVRPEHKTARRRKATAGTIGPRTA